MLTTLGVLLTLYLTAAIVLSQVQERMLFPAPIIPVDDLTEMARIAGANELSVPSGEETLYGWHSPAGAPMRSSTSTATPATPPPTS